MRIPLLILAAAWLILLLLELAGRGSPAFTAASDVIWIFFILEFLAELLISPDKALFLRQNWLPLVSLFIPALRLVRGLGVVRAIPVRHFQLVQVFTRVNRNVTLFLKSLRSRGIVAVLVVTAIVIIAASHAIYAFERGPELPDYGSALWWSAMMMTTMGSGFWPKTPEGRVLAFFIAVYAFSFFGYFTASVASFFLGKEKSP
jgi:voltage-gated potassium channel